MIDSTKWADHAVQSHTQRGSIFDPWREMAGVWINSGYDGFMSVTLPLNEMTVAEKLQLMEVIWEDLSRNSDALESPEWHRDVLEDRERRIASGEAQFSDWEHAKTDIRKRVS